MARRRIPSETRRRTWTEGTVWELLAAAGALPYRFASPLADVGMTAREHRQFQREMAVLKTTAIAYILPRPGTARRAPERWLSVRTRRTGYYRVNDAGTIERYGKRTQWLGSGSSTAHRWYPCSLRGVRWLQVVADGLLVRKVNQLQTPRENTTDTSALISAEPVGDTEKVAAAIPPNDALSAPVPTSRAAAGVVCPGFKANQKGTQMAKFTSENAAGHGRRGGQQSHRRSEEQYADLVLANPSAAQRVAHLIQRGHRLGLALRVIRISDRLSRGGR